jgi:hypothetical protein
MWGRKDERAALERALEAAAGLKVGAWSSVEAFAMLAIEAQGRPEAETSTRGHDKRPRASLQALGKAFVPSRGWRERGESSDSIRTAEPDTYRHRTQSRPGASTARQDLLAPARHPQSGERSYCSS